MNRDRKMNVAIAALAILLGGLTFSVQCGDGTKVVVTLPTIPLQGVPLPLEATQVTSMGNDATVTNACLSGACSDVWGGIHE